MSKTLYECPCLAPVSGSVAWRFLTTAWRVLVPILLEFLTACSSGTSMLQEPLYQLQSPRITNAADFNLDASLHGLITVNSPGSFARNAIWDEYRIGFANLSGEALSIQQIAIYDQEDVRTETTGNLRQLVKKSRQAAKRFRNQGVKVQGGNNDTILLASGTTALVGGLGTGIAGWAGSATAASVAGIAVAGVIAAPVLITASLVQSHRKRQVAKTIEERQVQLPLELEVDESIGVSVFFPLTPAPKFIEISYSASDRNADLRLDLEAQFEGLHLAAKQQ
jgi:hypothetical protein